MGTSIVASWMIGTLVSLHPRINLSPFTKDFRGEEHNNESIDKFLKLHLLVKQYTKIKEVTLLCDKPAFTEI